jgi:hypothetical protein
MLTRTRLRKALGAAVLLLATGLAACAGAAKEGAAAAAGAPDGLTVITVRNDHQSGRDIIVYLDPQDIGERIRIGAVTAGQTGTFNHEVVRGRYRIVAASAMGEVRSDAFSITGPAHVNWQMNSNRLTVRRR